MSFNFPDSWGPFPGAQFPYTQTGALNMNWVLHEIHNMQHVLHTFIDTSTIKLADPVEWAITTQYAPNTIVVDPDTNIAYVSLSPVPAGVQLSNSKYWLPIFDLSEAVNYLARSWQHTPEYYGAVGDGVADDTDAVTQWASQDATVLYLSPGSSYRVTRPITIADKSIIGQGARIISTTADTAMLITNSDADHYGFAQDFTIAVDDTCQTALHLSTWRYLCRNITLTNVHNTGCLVDTGYENTLSHMYVDCKNCGVSSVGFHFRDSDCCLLDSVARDCHTGIICDAATYVRNYHAWTAWSALDNSAVFAQINSADCVFDGCYADTYPNAFSLTKQSMQTRLIGCTVFCNEYFYTEGKFASLPPALITTPSDANTQCMHIVGASLKPVSFATPGVLIMRAGNYQGYIDQSSFAVASEPHMQCLYTLGVTGGTPDVSELTVHGDMLSLVFSAPAGTYNIKFPYGAVPSNGILYFSDGDTVKSTTISPSQHSATITASGYINCNFISPRVYPQF